MNTLESQAIHTQQAAGRAWADLMTDPRNETLRANYDQAKRQQDLAYDAWKEAQ